VSRPRYAISTFLPAVFLAAVAGCVIACSSATRGAEKITADSIPTVAVAKAGHANLSRTVVLTAEFIPFQEIDVMAKEAGYIKQIKVDIGDRVKQGQILATLEIPEMIDEIAKAQAAMGRSEAQVTQAQDEIKRAQVAFDIAHLSYDRIAGVDKSHPGLVAQQEIDDAKSKEDSAQAQVAAAKSNLAAAIQQVSLSKAEISRLNTLRDYTQITAPFAGVITKRFANTGSMIQAGTASQTQAMPIVRLSQNTLLRLTLPVPESVVPTIHVGQQVDVKVPSLQRTFPGVVARSAGQVQTSTRTMDTEVDVKNADLVLVPGMYAEVDLTLQHHRDALAVPVTAVDLDPANSDSSGESWRNGTRQKQGSVMLVTSEGRLEPRKVTLGMETSTSFEVLAGVREGDLVVVGSRSGLQAGKIVKTKITDMSAEQGN
jgi:RND family efflux transporter MFP subunit